jgi:NhaA family Na+:H+ antiporter
MTLMEEFNMAEDIKICDELSGLPIEPIDSIVDPLKRFLHIESTSGIVLLAATILALLLANSFIEEDFLALWKKMFGFRIGEFQMNYSFQHWINDFLMTIFFFVIGLEVKRELVLGELRDIRRAALPIIGAIGGMLVPALIYFALQHGSPAERGWGIPMATDIAFVVGCLAVLGSRIPNSLRVMLLSLAIVDDIGTILVIAIGYTKSLNLNALMLGLLGIACLLGLMKLGVRNVAVYLGVALLIWFAFHESGIHATIAGVIVGLLTPTKAWISEGRLRKIVNRSMCFLQGEGWSSSSERNAALRRIERAARKTISPLERFETYLHPWVGFVIMPVFALANAGVTIHVSDFTNPVAVAVIIGLFVGKPVGVVLFSWVGVKSGLAKLPEGVNWSMIIGGGFLAGIGFTMAIFIANLALDGSLLSAAKVGILAGSVLSAVVGVILLILFQPKREQVK